MKYKKIYQFLLWDNCKNNCKFCFQRLNARIYDITTKQQILYKTLQFLNSSNYILGSHILVCGGEIFDSPEDENILNNFFKKIIQKMNNKQIDLLYINTNLIYKNTNCLFNFLNLIKQNKLFNRLKFTTSYDLKGRFKSKQTESLMLFNLKNIKDLYFNCNIVVNMILTKPVCNNIINRVFKPNNFMKEYSCWINFIPYIILDESLAASREEIFKALSVINSSCENYLDTYIKNMSIKQEKILYKYQNNQFQYCSCPLSKCGHSINFKKYSNKNTCFCCDIQKVFNIYA